MNEIQYRVFEIDGPYVGTYWAESEDEAVTAYIRDEGYETMQDMLDDHDDTESFGFYAEAV